MTVLDRLASSQGIKGEKPNQELALELATSENAADIRVLVESVENGSPAVQSDCIKTLYEIGYLKPRLIAKHAVRFVEMLSSKNNRLVWGGMIALSTIGAIAARALYPHADSIERAMEKGSVITMDAGVLALARIASAKVEYNRAIFPSLLRHLQTCRPKEVPQHSEKTLEAVTAGNKKEFIGVVGKRLKSATPSEAVRLRRVIAAAEKKKK
jgi:hypothetical protein